MNMFIKGGGMGDAERSTTSWKQEQKLKMEWVMSSNDVVRWGSVVEKSASSEQKVVDDLKQYLAEKNLYIGPTTFTSGFILVLYEACRSGAISFVQYLLENHIGQFDIDQLILYHPICSYYRYKRQNLSISAQLDHRKETLLHAASKHSSTGMLKLLVSHGASVNIPDCCSLTPLLRAVVMSRSIDVIKYLLTAGANIDYQDRDGCTALMHSCCIKNKEIFEVLLKAGADPSLSDHKGYTVVHKVIVHTEAEALDFLLSFKVLPFCNPETTQVQPLFLADRNDHDFISEIYMHRFYFSFLPEYFHHPDSYRLDRLLDHPLCPPHLKVDIMLLNAGNLFFHFSLALNANETQLRDDSYNLFKKALTHKAQLKLPPPRLSKPIEMYGGLTEIASIEEFEEKYSDSANVPTQINLAYQHLLIRERCLGYGDSTVISYLLSFGQWMIFVDHHVQGLLLWHRATEMLLHCLEIDHIMSGLLLELQSILNYSFKTCVDFTMHYLRKVLEQKLPMTDSSLKYDSQGLFIATVKNLIECQKLSCDKYKKQHVHRYDSLFEGGHHDLLELLNNLLLYPVLNDDIKLLGCEAVAKCSSFFTSSGWPSNLLDLALMRYNKDEAIPFLTLLLECGSTKLINDVGQHGIRPVGKATTKAITSLLIAYGAHVDAASIGGYMGGNPHLKDLQYPFPLTCLSAKTIVSESIPYRSIDLPPHIVEFIALHDPMASEFFQ